MMTFTQREWQSVVFVVTAKAQNALECKHPTARWWRALKAKAMLLKNVDKAEQSAQAILSRLVIEFPGIVLDTETNGADVIERLGSMIDESPELKKELTVLADAAIEEEG